MNIPRAPKSDCALCAAMGRIYDDECRNCFIRRIAHMPIKHRGEQYRRISQAHGHRVMTIISEEVTAHYKQHKSWGTFA